MARIPLTMHVMYKFRHAKNTLNNYKHAQHTPFSMTIQEKTIVIPTDIPPFKTEDNQDKHRARLSSTDM